MPSMCQNDTDKSRTYRVMLIRLLSMVLDVFHWDWGRVDAAMVMVARMVVVMGMVMISGLGLVVEVDMVVMVLFVVRVMTV